MEELSDTCRLCGSELQGNQRRWLFHRDPRPPDLRLLLAHVLGREPPRRGDGRGEFLCGKCAQALGRLFRFDAVIARVQALSLERLRRLLVEKERLARCLRHLHARRGPDAGLAPGAQPPDPSYQRLLQEDLALSGLECWAEGGGPGAGSPPCQNRWCHGCHGLRVADSDYEWVCRTPRRLGAGSPTLPLCRDKSQSMPLVLGAGAGGHRGSRLSLRSGSLGTASSCSLLSLDALAGPETLGQALRALRGVGRRALRAPRGSRIPVLAGRAAPPALPREMEEDEEEDEDLGDEFLPLGVKDLGGRRLPALTGAVGQLTGRLVAAEAELRSLRAKTGGPPTEDVGVPSGPGPMRGQEWLLGPLARCLHSKEAALQDCLAALETLVPPGAEPPALETLVLHLCQRLKERDQALERHLADGASARAQDQRELTRLRETLRDKDADLGRLVAALRAGEQTVHALREMLEQKELEQGQLASLCAVAQDAWRRQDQTRALALQEKEELVAALQAALTSSTKDMEVLAESLEGPSPGLLQRLREQEGLLAEALAERARLGAAMETRLQEALAAQAAAEQQLQDQLRGCTQALAERAQEAGALRGRLAQQAGALAEGATALAWCQAELAQVRGLLEERDQALLKAAQEAEEKDGAVLAAGRMKPVLSWVWRVGARLCPRQGRSWPPRAPPLAMALG